MKKKTPQSNCLHLFTEVRIQNIRLAQKAIEALNREGWRLAGLLDLSDNTFVLVFHRLIEDAHV